MWHTVRAEVHGHNMVVSVDDGDGWRQNYSLPSLIQHPKNDNRAQSRILKDVTGPPTPLEIDEKDGVNVGGLPEFVGKKLIKVYDDLKDSEYFYRLYFKKFLWIKSFSQLPFCQN